MPEQRIVVGFDGAELPWLGATVLTSVVRPPDGTLPVTLRIGTTSAPPPAD